MNRLLIFLFLIALKPASGQLIFDAELGGATTSRNVFRFPNGQNSQADKLAVANTLGNSWQFYYRARISYIIAQKHLISALYAPLRVQYTGGLQGDFNAGQVSFVRQLPVEVQYKFNSYRLTYRYKWFSKGTWRFGIGLTAKLRDARIRVSNGFESTETTDLGFVPLVNFNLECHLSEKWFVNLRGDALVGKQGRAEDIMLAINYQPYANHTFRFGYRVLEGGADVDQVYNFSLIQYLGLGYRYRLFGD